MKPVVCVALAVLGFWFLSSCGDSAEIKQKKQKELAGKKQAEEQAQNEIEKKQNAILRELTEKHNALTPEEWRPKDNSRPFLPDPLTMALDYKLINKEGRPALIIGRLLDAYQSNDKHFLKLTTNRKYFRYDREASIDFYLNCPKGIVDEVLRLKKENIWFAVVAKFHKFRKLDYIVGADVDGEMVEISTDFSKGFFARGSCIEVKAWPELK